MTSERERARESVIAGEIVSKRERERERESERERQNNMHVSWCKRGVV